jgi:hypothetical protein
MTEVTTTARRVAKRLNGLGASYSGGFCVFGADGSGGYFYTGNSYPPLAAGQFRMWVAERRVSARDIQELLDDRQED